MTNANPGVSLSLILAAAGLAATQPVLAVECADLYQLGSYTVEISASEDRDDATIEQAFGPGLSLVAHCRVAATLRPRPTSEIRMEVWLPADWNGKFLALGNGGWAGSIGFPAMATGLAAGYAVASNDTGHQGGSAAFAIGNRDKVVDFAWRAMHEMTVIAKAVIENYYQSPPRLSYFQGCSTGGRQGMKEAQMYPADYNAIIVGAPVNNQLTLNATQFDSILRFLDDPDLALSADKVELVHNAVLDVCEVDDGVADGFLNDPLACGFDPKSLQCERRRDTVGCLTRDEVSSVERAYAGVTSATGRLLYPGHAKGFELGWRIPAAGSEPSALQTDATRYLVYEDPDWDWREFDLERDLNLALERAGYIEALETDLSAFKARGGKILFYHGWNDPGPSPINTINYYDSVLADMGPDQGDWMRLFMVPGMGHCAGGIGPDQADFLGALDAWVENGVAPKRIIASRTRDGETDMTRPLCAYPEVAVWDRAGNPNDAASFSCE
jgi:feruloyl esterase